MKGENGTPETPDWCPDKPRPCPFDCGICETPQQSIFMHGVEEHIIRGTE